MAMYVSADELGSDGGGKGDGGSSSQPSKLVSHDNISYLMEYY